MTMDQAYEAFHSIAMKPAYLNKFTMGLDEVLLSDDAASSKLKIVQSPNFPAAGKGLVSVRVITPTYKIPYWGKLFLHKFKECNLAELNIDDCFRDRLIKLKFQPFKRFAYILGL